MTCCICGEAAFPNEPLCFLQVHEIKAFYHHLKCGHMDGTGTGLTPEMAACVEKLKAYAGLIEVTEGT